MVPRYHVVFLVPGFPKDKNDTECIPAVQNYILYFAKLNPEIRVTVMAFQYPFSAGKYRWHHIDVYAAGGRNRRRWFRALTWMRVVYAFFRLARKTDIVVIHSFWLEECAYVGQYLARAFKIKHVASIGGQDAKPTNRFLKRLDFSRLTLTAGSQFAAAILHAATHRQVEKIIPLGLDHRQFGTIPATASRPIDILGVGSLIPLKNFALFVEIISVLTTAFPELQAQIIGDGPQKQYLEHLIQQHVPNNIQLLGQLPRRDVITHMTQSKILLHTSSYESQGYVFIEALYCGMTVVSFDVGYLGQTGKACKCNDKHEMIAKLQELLNQPLAFDQILLKPVEETVQEFLEAYAL